MRQLEQMLTIPRPLTEENTSLVSIALIDNTDIVRNFDTPEALQLVMQLTIATCTTISEASGGAIEPTKSFWYAAKRFQDKCIWKVYTHKVDTPVVLPDHFVPPTALKLVKHDEARMKLGVYLCPSSNFLKQVDILVDHSHSWVKPIERVGLIHSGVWLACSTIICCKWVYIAPAIALSDSQ
jgi:hypothetical protein